MQKVWPTICGWSEATVCIITVGHRPNSNQNIALAARSTTCSDAMASHLITNDHYDTNSNQWQQFLNPGCYINLYCFANLAQLKDLENTVNISSHWGKWCLPYSLHHLSRPPSRIHTEPRCKSVSAYLCTFFGNWISYMYAVFATRNKLTDIVAI